MSVLSTATNGSSNVAVISSFPKVALAHLRYFLSFVSLLLLVRLNRDLQALNIFLLTQQYYISSPPFFSTCPLRSCVYLKPFIDISIPASSTTIHFQASNTSVLTTYIKRIPSHRLIISPTIIHSLAHQYS